MSSPKIYTRTGDKGKTSLIGGARVSKAHVRLDAYGTLDELNSIVGMLRFEGGDELSRPSAPAEAGVARARIDAILAEIQNDLFNVGSHLACEDSAMRTKLPSVGEVHVTELERAMDEFSSDLAPLKNFILPGGSRAASIAHHARTVCRRAERSCVALSDAAAEDGTTVDKVDEIVVVYINRLSDFFFVLARHFNRVLGIPETVWAPKK